jgi:adenylate kinase family enzyme
MRVSIIGPPGSGKSQLGRALASDLGVAHLELDSIYHQPGWVPLPDDQFLERVKALAAADSWVIDGNYRSVQTLIWSRADAVVWLDLPRRITMTRLTRRTLIRGLTRRELWNGNQESLTNLLRRGDRNILVWAWSHHRIYHERYLGAAVDPALCSVRFLRIRTAAEADPARVRRRLDEGHRTSD